MLMIKYLFLVPVEKMVLFIIIYQNYGTNKIIKETSSADERNLQLERKLGRVYVTICAYGHKINITKKINMII